ncbi:MAG: hypothetical protein DRJ97_03970 [Thermoprotei archaeon]|nr:MAG: hypothetical protein DRJ97_03970 [Thermoprotei archaeon]
MVGMRKETPVFQGMIGIYLGTFKVIEPACGFELLIEDLPPSFFIEGGEAIKAQPLDELVSKYGCKLIQQVDGQRLKIKGIFSNFESPSIEPLTDSDVENIAKELIGKLSKTGLKVVGAKTFRVEVEHSIDPALIARTRLKDVDGLKYEWVL